MIYAVIREKRPEAEPDADAGLYHFDTWEDMNRETFSPDLEILVAWKAGRFYGKNKARARAALKYLSRAAAAPGLSWYEYHLIMAHAENVARRAGLLREARKNGIC